jgi:hypothetical protein
VKKIVCFCLFFIVQVAYGLPDPVISLYFPITPKSTVYYGESLTIPVVLNYQYLRDSETWYIPSGVSLYPASGPCPSIPNDRGKYIVGVCTMNLVIPGNDLGTVLSGHLTFQAKGNERSRSWNQFYYTPSFWVLVIPHPLSLRQIPYQQATANLAFILPIKAYVNYYDENLRAGTQPQITVLPEEQDGLHYDAKQQSIVGSPSHTGVYWFHVAAQSTNSNTTAVDIRIDVAFNPKDKPVFKQSPIIQSVAPGARYSLNLMDLIEPQNGLIQSNPIVFQIQPEDNTPSWVSISSVNPTQLEADIPQDRAGGEILLTLVATSNTGGHSNPFRLKIPVAHDPNKQPIIQPFELEQAAGSRLYVDVGSHIFDPTQDLNLAVNLQGTEPQALWLHVSSNSPTVLEGLVPEEVVGQTYQLSLNASNTVGGSSKTIIVPLHIKTDKTYTPRFKTSPLILPIFYAHQRYFYDFMTNADVYPEYDEAPYDISFADGFKHPSWLHIEHNALLATDIPELEADLIIHLVIKNIPGGISEVFDLKLTVMK